MPLNKLYFLILEFYWRALPSFSFFRFSRENSTPPRPLTQHIANSVAHKQTYRQTNKQTITDPLGSRWTTSAAVGSRLRHREKQTVSTAGAVNSVDTRRVGGGWRLVSYTVFESKNKVWDERTWRRSGSVVLPLWCNARANLHGDLYLMQQQMERKGDASCRSVPHKARLKPCDWRRHWYSYLRLHKQLCVCVLYWMSNFSFLFVVRLWFVGWSLAVSKSIHAWYCSSTTARLLRTSNASCCLWTHHFLPPSWKPFLRLLSS